MDLKLRGKRALVTGSTQGIGFAIAKGLAREGAAVVVNGRSEAKVNDAVKRIAAETKAIGDRHRRRCRQRRARSIVCWPSSDLSIFSSTMPASSSRSRLLEIPDSDWLRISR